MEKKFNFHTHTLFCDGHNTPEEMVLSAIEKKFDILGFSSHSMYPFAADWHIAPREHENYVKEINNLKEKYKNKISIKLGFEVDYIPGISCPNKENFINFNPDYLIGSVHYILLKEGNFAVDDSTKNVKAGIEKYYKGREKDCVCKYFELQREMLEKGNFEILGHPDLIRKRNDELNFFKENESWYKEELKATAKAAKKAGVIAEINTGAIARKAMDDVYPSCQFLEYLFNEKVPIMINSDAHDAKDLDCAFDRARLCALKAGYKEVTYPENGNFISINL